MINELLKLANHLDAKSLRKEADYLDVVIKKFSEVDEEEQNALNGLRSIFNDRDPAEEPGLSEDAKVAIGRFIMNNLSEDAMVWSSGEETKLLDILYNDSQDLKEYMIEAIPEKIDDLARELGSDPETVKDLILNQAMEMEQYREDDGDFGYVVDSMKFYLRDYVFEVSPEVNVEYVDTRGLDGTPTRTPKSVFDKIDKDRARYAPSVEPYEETDLDDFDF
jgi:hypothetical protein